MRVLALDAASMVTSSPIGTYSPMRQLPTSISKNVAPEALQTDLSEQRPPSLGSRVPARNCLAGGKKSPTTCIRASEPFSVGN